MPLEVDYQKAIIEAVKDDGGYGLKMSNRFLVGVPDLLLHPGWLPTMIVEVKRDSLPARPDTKMTIDISPNQRKNLLAFQKSGGVAGWLLVVPIKTGVVDVLGHGDIDFRPTRQEFETWSIRKTPQTGWNLAVKSALNRIFKTSSHELSRNSPAR